MLARLLQQLLIMAIVSATDVSEVKNVSPEVESPKVGFNNFSKHGWGIYDFSMGLLIGAYGPLIRLARGGDCFS